VSRMNKKLKRLLTEAAKKRYGKKNPLPPFYDKLALTDKNIKDDLVRELVELAKKFNPQQFSTLSQNDKVFVGLKRNLPKHFQRGRLYYAWDTRELFAYNGGQWARIAWDERELTQEEKIETAQSMAKAGLMTPKDAASFSGFKFDEIAPPHLNCSQCKHYHGGSCSLNSTPAGELCESYVAIDNQVEISEEDFGEGMFEVECIDNSGKEEEFDIGVTYIAKNHADKTNSDMIIVFDKFGQEQECFKNRFKKTENSS